MTTPELGEEDQLLMRLKEDENLPWKDIAARFLSELGKTYQVPALQMRFKRLRERIRPWTDVDINALRMAHEHWEKNKFEIISQKVSNFTGLPSVTLALTKPHRCLNLVLAKNGQPNCAPESGKRSTQLTTAT